MPRMNPQREQARKLLKEGLTYEEIKAHTDIPPQCIYRAASDLRDQGVSLNANKIKRGGLINSFAKKGSISDILTKLTTEELRAVSKMRGDTWADMLVNYIRQ